MSTEDLEQYEAEIELQLYKEYKDVAPMFSLRGGDRAALLPRQRGRAERAQRGRAHLVELEMRDAWVWDMYRTDPLRGVGADRDVQGRQHRGAPQEGAVSCGRRPRPAAAGRGRGSAAAAWYEAHGYEVVARNWRCREGELDLVVRRGRRCSCSVR